MLARNSPPAACRRSSSLPSRRGHFIPSSTRPNCLRSGLCPYSGSRLPAPFVHVSWPLPRLAPSSTTRNLQPAPSRLRHRRAPRRHLCARAHILFPSSRGSSPAVALCTRTAASAVSRTGAGVPALACPVAEWWPTRGDTCGRICHPTSEGRARVNFIAECIRAGYGEVTKCALWTKSRAVALIACDCLDNGWWAGRSTGSADR